MAFTLIERKLNSTISYKYSYGSIVQMTTTKRKQKLIENNQLHHDHFGNINKFIE